MTHRPRPVHYPNSEFRIRLETHSHTAEEINPSLREIIRVVVFFVAYHARVDRGVGFIFSVENVVHIHKEF